MNQPKIEATGYFLRDAVALGAALATEQPSIEGRPYLVIPEGYKVQDMEAMLPAPLRAKGIRKLADAESFIRFVNKHKDKVGVESAANSGTEGKDGTITATADPDDMQTEILVDVIASKFKALFNAHASDAPGWGDFGASYDCPLTEEWKTWTAKDGVKMAQEEFAFFVEQNILDIHAPTGAEMLQVVTTLKTAKNVAFDSGIRLADGQVQLKYHEELASKAGQTGEMKIPEEITLGLPVYIGGDPYAVKAKFRYRIEGTRLSMWYDLITPHKILEAALAKVTTQIEEGTGIQAYAVAGF